MIGFVSFLFRIFNRFMPWYRLPFPFSILNIIGLQHDLRRNNLHSTSRENIAPPAKGDFDVRTCRTADGSFNDLSDPAMGMCGMRFGRNIRLDHTYGEKEPELMTPNPRLISNKLLARKTFIPVPYLNLHAASWLQFMTHDWFNHGESDPNRVFQVPLPEGDTWTAPNHKPGCMSIRASQPDPWVYAADEGMPATYRNHETHWWDGSQIYGSSEARVAQMRRDPAGNLVPGGKIYLDERGLLAIDPSDGIELAGNNGNWWVGLSLLTNLFIREHNAITSHLAASYPHQSDDWLYHKARLINAALMAKIHQVEWTPALLNSPDLRFVQRGNWWGALGEEYERAYGRDKRLDLISGIPGSWSDHHTAPYSMTEEFVAAYRMHPLLPDEVAFRKLGDNDVVDTLSLQECAGTETRAIYDHITLADAHYTFGVSNPGALTLHNYPNVLRRFQDQDNSRQIVDLAAIDILRDRERGVPRYCELRRHLRMSVPRTFEELTGGNQEQAGEISQVYATVEDVDFLVGALVEPLPTGFGFSDTAFRIFIVMATRRFKSDRFYTDDFNDKTYTPEGMQWIRDNLFGTVMVRHFPELKNKIGRVKNGFFAWPLD